MNVLSLFDGMSCGQIALNRAGIKYDKYFASEIKKHAIKVTMTNYPNTIQLGDVRYIKGNHLPKIDLLIGGSPCQDFSRIKVNEDRSGLNGKKSVLFWEYYRLLKDVKPRYFLLENVKMRKEQKEQLDALMGVKGININYNLVSFQNRDRFYWTNIPNITIPKDNNLSFQDFKERNPDVLKKYKVNKTPSRILMWEKQCPNVTFRDKINCLTCKQDRRNNSGLVEFDGFCRYLTRGECEMAQNVPVGYTSGVPIGQAYDLLGDGWTVDVIAHIFKGIQKEAMDGLSQN